MFLNVASKTVFKKQNKNRSSEVKLELDKLYKNTAESSVSIVHRHDLIFSIVVGQVLPINPTDKQADQQLAQLAHTVNFDKVVQRRAQQK